MLQWIAALYGLLLLCALLATGPRALRVAAMQVSLLAIPLTLLAPSFPPLRAFMGLAGGWGIITIIGLAQDRSGMKAGQRAWHLFALFDTRRITQIPRGIDLLHNLRFLGFGLLCAGSLYVAVVVANEYSGALHYLIRWGAAAVFEYAAWDAATAGTVAFYKPFGVAPPKLHDDPFQSRSLQEFWGQRWNRIVGDFLRNTFYLPLAKRRRPALGLVAAFVGSAFLHFYFIHVALGFPMSLVMASFFLLQILLVSLERWWRIKRWPDALARAWTLGILLITSPLHMEPMLRVIEPLFYLQS